MVYENVLSGSFIYSLGVIAGKRMDPNLGVSDSINFFQQTPTDKVVGDLLAHWNNKLFIIEFKRSVNQLSDEVNKFSKQNLPDLFISDNEISDISRKCHFIGYGVYSEMVVQNQPRIKTDFTFQNYYSLMTQRPSKNFLLNSFIDSMLTDDNMGLKSTADFGKYLAFLYSNCLFSKPSSTSAGRVVPKPITGIITSVSESGEVVMIQYKNYHELVYLMRMKISLAKNLEQQRNVTNEILRDIQIDQGKDKKIDRGGPSF